jgi:hypothetical protein
MKVLLISANTETINMVPLPLGLNCVAVAARNAGHEVRLLDLMGGGANAGRIRSAIDEVHPEVIGISVRNVDNQHMAEARFLLEPVRDLVATCREFSGATIVVGGAGFSIFPEAALRYLKSGHGDLRGRRGGFRGAPRSAAAGAKGCGVSPGSASPAPRSRKGAPSGRT